MSKKSKSIKDAGTMRLKTLHKAGVKDMSHMFSNMPKVEEHHLVCADEAQLQILELLQHKHPKIRALAEDQLTHLFKEDGEVKVKDGGFLPIAEMLKYKDVDVQSGALWSCSALAASSEDNHDALISDIGWELLKSRARGAGDIKEAAISTIANLCINEAMHDMVMNEGGLQLIKNAAGDDSMLLKRAAANAFANLTASPENIPAVLADGGFEKILNFLRSGDDELVAAALHILANILPHDPFYKEQLINGGYVPEIVDLMNSNNSLIRNGATAVIRQLLGDHNTHNHLLGMGVLDTLCKLSRRPEPQLQFLVAASLNELAGNAEIRAQVKEVATNPLKQLARSRDPEVKKEAIEALNKLGIRVLSKAEKEEKERLEKEAAAREKAEREAAERAAREKAEREAREAREAAERAAREKAEREAAERAAREKAEREAREAREAADRRAREDADRRAREDADRKAKDDAERRAREEAERRAREEAERRAREEADRRAREEAERRAREEADRRAREEADRQRRAKEDAERRAREEAERRAREEADRLAREQAERDLAALHVDKDEEWRRTLLEEMNFARTQPQEYAKELEKLRSQYEGNDFYLTPQRIIETDEGISALEDAISFFKRQRPLPPFERCSMGMCKSCEDLCNELGPSGRARGGDSSERWERYGKWSGRMVEIIGYRIDDPKTAVQQWMIDDGDPDRINRKHILDTQFQVVGFAHSFHATRKTICVVQFATTFSENENAQNNAPRAVPLVDHNADPNATHIVIVSEQLDVSSAGILLLHARGRQLLLTTTVNEEVVGNTVKSININNRWQLPVNFNPNEVEARFQNKKLTIKVPKQPRAALVNRSINDSVPVKIL